MTSMPIWLEAGFAMAPKMAMEAMIKEVVVFMMNWFDIVRVLVDGPELIVDVIDMFVVECDFSRQSWEGRVFYIHQLADKRLASALFL